MDKQSQDIVAGVLDRVEELREELDDMAERLRFLLPRPPIVREVRNAEEELSPEYYSGTFASNEYLEHWLWHGRERDWYGREYELQPYDHRIPRRTP